MYSANGKRQARRISGGGWAVPAVPTESSPSPLALPHPGRRLRAVLVDPDALARRHLLQFLDTEPGFAVTAECDTARAARAAVRRENPDLLFLDIAIPDADG